MHTCTVYQHKQTLPIIDSNLLSADNQLKLKLKKNFQSIYVFFHKTLSLYNNLLLFQDINNELNQVILKIVWINAVKSASAIRDILHLSEIFNALLIVINSYEIIDSLVIHN